MKLKEKIERIERGEVSKELEIGCYEKEGNTYYYSLCSIFGMFLFKVIEEINGTCKLVMKIIYKPKAIYSETFHKAKFSNKNEAFCFLDGWLTCWKARDSN